MTPRPSYLSVAAIAAIGIAVAATAATILSTADALPRDIGAVLSVRQQERDGSMIMIVCGAPTGVAKGIGLALIGLLIGGIPASILAAALNVRSRGAERRWAAACSSMFLAGFVFQLCSLVFTVFLLVVIIAAAADGQGVSMDATPAALLLSSACSVWGLRSWRTLQRSVHELPLRVTPDAAQPGM